MNKILIALVLAVVMSGSPRASEAIKEDRTDKLYRLTLEKTMCGVSVFCWLKIIYGIDKNDKEIFIMEFTRTCDDWKYPIRSCKAGPRFKGYWSGNGKKNPPVREQVLEKFGKMVEWSEIARETRVRRTKILGCLHPKIKKISQECKTKGFSGKKNEVGIQFVASADKKTIGLVFSITDYRSRSDSGQFGMFNNEKGDSVDRIYESLLSLDSAYEKIRMDIIDFKEKKNKDLSVPDPYL